MNKLKEKKIEPILRGYRHTVPTGKSKNNPHPKDNGTPQTKYFHLFSINATVSIPQPSPMNRIAIAICLLVDFCAGSAETLAD